MFATPSRSGLTPWHSRRFASAGLLVAWDDATTEPRFARRSFALCTIKETVFMSLGTILLIILVIVLLGGFSGIGGGRFYGTGYYGGGGLGLVVVILLILVLLGKL